MRHIVTILLDIVHPPQGIWVRKVVILLATGLSYSMLNGTRHVPIGMFTNDIYGVFFGVVAILLLLSYDYRRSWFGRGAAVIGASVFGMLLWDTALVSTSSAVVCFVAAYACIGEAGFVHES